MFAPGDAQLADGADHLDDHAVERALQTVEIHRHFADEMSENQRDQQHRQPNPKTDLG
jgi:hypothetical protein